MTDQTNQTRNARNREVWDTLAKNLKYIKSFTATGRRKNKPQKTEREKHLRIKREI